MGGIRRDTHINKGLRLRILRESDKFVITTESGTHDMAIQPFSRLIDNVPDAALYTSRYRRRTSLTLGCE